jgi:hypothetical protein
LVIKFVVKGATIHHERLLPVDEIDLTACRAIARLQKEYGAMPEAVQLANCAASDGPTSTYAELVWRYGTMGMLAASHGDFQSAFHDWQRQMTGSAVG